MRTNVYFIFEILFFFRKVSGICYRLGPTEPRSENKDVCLRGYEYFTFKSPQLEKCEVQCLSNNICKSVNFHKTKKICALNNESEHTVGRHNFQTCPGAIHVDVMEMKGMQGYLGKCMNHTCPTETVCVPEPTGTKPHYSCLKQDNCANAKFCPAPSTADMCPKECPTNSLLGASGECTRCDPECKGQFECCSEIGDYDGCSTTDEIGLCYCKHGVADSVNYLCCKQCSDEDKEQCCTLNDTDCGTANIGECYCKFGEDPSGNCFSGHVIICLGLEGDVQCPLGKNISVFDAYFGRTHDGTICPHPAIFDQNCREDSSFEMIKNTCNNKQVCRLDASSSIYGDPCFGTFKYIEVKFFCVAV